ncbi:alpha/beta hydrolase [Tautonia plasticadhaerens]|uniref:Carboxylesterase NlhH n=1 Tax=Tautonia plasticadhaerens TaxID=2527974 RepID=A0A518H8D1_9BACT|nr:alpha/beta hydrolase [Tautonia plasticadhaerens]QDV37071.1 Carboxylesterase NlhH [Tautonia plasticadhaerens]
MRRRRNLGWGVIALAAMSVSLAAAQQLPKERPDPDRSDVRYGPHGRNVLDFWSAESGTPAPLLVYIHGGGFRGGDKKGIPPGLLRGCLESGISVASINYRLSHQAPFPAPMLDGARAIQFLRSKAEELEIDLDRIAASGGSAGAGISLWVGFHDDLAEPESDDPVARQSSRLACMAVVGAQTTYDPRVIATIIGGRAHQHPALPPFFGLPEDMLDSDEAYELFERASPDSYLSADDPPAYLFYTEPRGPLPPDAPPGLGIHHPNFGEYLGVKMDGLGIECVTRHRDEFPEGSDDEDADLIGFLLRQFGMDEPGR